MIKQPTSAAQTLLQRGGYGFGAVVAIAEQTLEEGKHQVASDRRFEYAAGEVAEKSSAMGDVQLHTEYGEHDDGPCKVSPRVWERSGAHSPALTPKPKSK